ncbi:echotoxin-2-like [Mytilus galloprovincialis]|uniref:echotoxin-2-like n=1 Tax=Mytilus galloprovincialis TaxID=29158 RepID=UPI003F7CA445
MGSCKSINGLGILGSLLISSGLSMTKSGGGYSIECTVIVENWTKYPLTDARVTPYSGQLYSAAVSIRPGEKEQFITHKTSWSTYGSAGVASWLIGDGHGKRAVVMWSVPYSHWFHSNWLAVGLTESGNQAHKDWFSQMYYYESGSGLHFKRKDYYYDTNILSFKDEKFEITGIIGTSYKPTARIIIKPLNETDLAQGLKRDE